MNLHNIFSGIQKQAQGEIFDTIISSGQCKIERIISRGHTTDDGYWYDQANDEWVLLLKGSAGLLFEGGNEIVIMKPGDYVNIPAHQKHRVEWTASNEETIWLAVHY